MTGFNDPTDLTHDPRPGVPVVLVAGLVFAGSLVLAGLLALVAWDRGWWG